MSEWNWEGAKPAADLKVFYCKKCDAVHFVMLDADKNVISHVDTEVAFYKQMMGNVDKQVSGEIVLSPLH